jgi:hypothetical protein
MSVSTPSPRRRSILRVLVFVTIGCLVATALVAASAITLSREASALRHSMVSVDGLDAHLRVQGSVGPVLCTLVRFGLRWVDAVPPEAHEALAAVRGASVAVYELRQDVDAGQRAEVMEQAAATMQRRGWTRTVAVQDGDDNVLIFTAPARAKGNRIDVCVAVCSGRELVVVEARLRARELAAFVAARCPDLVRL